MLNSVVFQNQIKTYLTSPKRRSIVKLSVFVAREMNDTFNYCFSPDEKVFDIAEP